MLADVVHESLEITEYRCDRPPRETRKGWPFVQLAHGARSPNLKFSSGCGIPTFVSQRRRRHHHHHHHHNATTILPATHNCGNYAMPRTKRGVHFLVNLRSSLSSGVYSFAIFYSVKMSPNQRLYLPLAKISISYMNNNSRPCVYHQNVYEMFLYHFRPINHSKIIRMTRTFCTVQVKLDIYAYIRTLRGSQLLNDQRDLNETSGLPFVYMKTIICSNVRA